MRRADAAAIARFREATEILKELSAKGYSIYLANDSMHLMIGPTHDERGRPLQANSITSVIIPGSGGGDW